MSSKANSDASNNGHPATNHQPRMMDDQDKAERATLRGILSDNSDMLDHALRYLNPSNWQDPEYRAIAEALWTCHYRDSKRDPETVEAFLLDQHEIEAATALNALILPTPCPCRNDFHDGAHTVQNSKLTAAQFEFSTGDALNECLKEITWLWDGYIPNGFVTLLVGEQDAGKSTVAQNFCQTLLSAGRWPDGTQCDAAADELLWLDTEGSLALFRQRAQAWRMPLEKFIFPLDPLQELRVDRPDDWRWIEAAIERFKPRLIVLDSLSGSHSGEENSNDGMKEVLKRLSELAQRHQIAIMVIHHLSKAAPGVPDYPVNLSRARGAGAITQFCRSVIALTAPDPHTPTARRLDVIKLNLAMKPPAVGYELTDNGPAWGNAPEPPQQRRAADDAIDWLREAMGDGMRPSDEIKAEASAAGISYNALNDARKALEVTAKREGGKDGRWFLTMK
jgi:putative DNA primase/helicase